ncbi:MAG: RdgB/HAM1 family non-canonical purine NTP pyrophosphatase [Gammaproteobacteria bacterium]|nr:RdgB/HAM1 family non-canonical purine NTP pyrophosphatase [Gammaproteobacteria bacterium]
MQRIVLASGNKGKLKEFSSILSSNEITLIPQSVFNVTEVAETGLSFVENALIKARNACFKTGLPSIADDSGLEVDALNGEPGIYSARYAKITGPKADAENNIKLLRNLKHVPEPERTARFQCAIVYLRHAKDPVPLVFQGSWEGRILFEEAGKNGFGYDPLFYVPNHSCSSAELDPDIKNSLSHRRKAIDQLSLCLKNRL